MIATQQFSAIIANVQRFAPSILPSGTNIHPRLVGLWPSGEQAR